MPHDSLTRITQWLAAHAPRILHESLNPGATDEQLKELEAAVGKPLPDDYKALYRWHNGLDEEAENWGSLFYGMSLSPLTEVLDAYLYQAPQTLTSPLLQAAPTLKSAVMQNPYWLRLGFDGSHSWLLVDLDPAETGSYGQVLYVYELDEIGFRVASSVTELLRTFAHDLEHNLYTLDEGAADDGNEFLVPAAHIDPGNYNQPGRWQHALSQTA